MPLAVVILLWSSIHHLTGHMSAEGYTREIDKYLRLIEAGTDLTEAENRGQTKRSYRVSRDTGIACITWSPVKRHARSKSKHAMVILVMIIPPGDAFFYSRCKRSVSCEQRKSRRKLQTLRHGISRCLLFDRLYVRK